MYFNTCLLCLFHGILVSSLCVIFCVRRSNHLSKHACLSEQLSNHDILLEKLEFNGIIGQAYNLLKLYLTNGHQKCQIDSSISSEHIIKRGVPEGSIPGPLPF